LVPFKIIGIGEILWDVLPSGKQLGGAPANFAYQAAALGAQASIISRVGDDVLGGEILSRLHNLGLSTETIQIDPTAPTGTVTVALDPKGQPHFTIHENVAWDNLRAGAGAQRSVSSADAVCFGSLAQRSKTAGSAIRSLVAGSSSKALRVLDVNLRQNYYSREIIHESLQLANVLKLNDTELPLLAEMFQLQGDDRSILAQLAERYSLSLAACTRGARGSLLFSRGLWSEHLGIPTKVVDTVGAGDAFTSAMVLGFLKGWPLDEINLRANQIASFVAASAGATPNLPPDLRAPFLKLTSEPVHT
jgi:fructokinase